MAALVLLWLGLGAASAQSLVNVDFGVGATSSKTGFAGTGQTTNDFWNLYRHYEPRYEPGMALVANGKLEGLRQADGAESPISLLVTNAPGVWGNASGDPMFDSYIFAQNGSNITATVNGLAPGRYHFYLYGHADPDVTGEQNSLFTLASGTNHFGPLGPQGSSRWKANSPWTEGHQFIVFRDVPVLADTPAVITVAAGPNGIPVLNGLQIISRGTSPPQLVRPAAPEAVEQSTNLVFRSIAYTGKLEARRASFTVEFEVESENTNEISAPLFSGAVAVQKPKLPKDLRLVNTPQGYRLFVAAPGVHKVSLELIARIESKDPWNQIQFTGPTAAIASVEARASDRDARLELLSGLTDPENSAPGKVAGFLNGSREVSLRWQSKTREVARKSLVTVETGAKVEITPSAAKLTTHLAYEILQAPLDSLLVELPARQSLTRLDGKQIRDWTVSEKDGRRVLRVEFLQPVDKAYELTLLTEMPIDALPADPALELAQPLDVQRESGTLGLAAEGVAVSIGEITGLRQVNADSGTLAAYRFFGRPVGLAVKLQRIEPVLQSLDRVEVAVEETRLLIRHHFDLNVDKAGIYQVTLNRQTGLIVSEVTGRGVEEWSAKDDSVTVTFSGRVLGQRRLEVVLEQSLPEFPETITVLPLRLAGAEKEEAMLSAGAVPGVELKTAELSGLREIPVASLPFRTDAMLAYTAYQANWRLSLATTRLAPRLLAEVFNIVTIGDGQVGGSATLRFAILNQGVQSLGVRVPAHWKNVDFTGANIRRLDQAPAGTNAAYVDWTIALQEKAWSAYTLVATYDYQFDPQGSTLDTEGAHARSVERESGSLAITSGAGLKLEARDVTAPLRRIDPTELSPEDTALLSRTPLLAYRYSGLATNHYTLKLGVERQDQVELLDAVADRTQLTTVLNEGGQMISQASFMIKNKDRQFQKFRLPEGAELWGCYVNNDPVKVETDGDWLLVSLPRKTNHDEAFAVDITYVQQAGDTTGLLPKELHLVAPETDVPNTYAEWELFTPSKLRVMDFAGTMKVDRGTTYGWSDAWQGFLKAYAMAWGRLKGFALFLGVMAVVGLALTRRGKKYGIQGVIEVIAVVGILAILAGMLMPALSKAKARSATVKSTSNLKQIAFAAMIWSNDHGNRFPDSLEQMIDVLGSPKLLVDPECDQQYIYVGAGKDESMTHALLAFSPVPNEIGQRAVAMADGSVSRISEEEFTNMLMVDASIMASRTGPSEVASSQSQQASPASPSAPMAAASGTAARFGAIQQANQLAPGNPMQVEAQPAPPPTTSGIRSIRIDIPKEGARVHFTKVLNTAGTPLDLSVKTLNRKTYERWQAFLQLAGLLGGLMILGWQRLRQEASSLQAAIGITLAGWAVCSFFIQVRMLHLVLCAAPPLLVLALIVLWFNRRKTRKAAKAGATAAGLVAFTLMSMTPNNSHAAKRPAPEPTAASASVSVDSASYQGRVDGNVAQFAAELRLSCVGTNETLRLFGKDVALREFTLSKGNARLEREDGDLQITFAGPGQAVAKLSFLVGLTGSVTERKLVFDPPPALSGAFSLEIAEPDADVAFPSAISFEAVTKGERTEVSAILGATPGVSLSWQPRVKRVAEIAATTFCEGASLAEFRGGVINLQTLLNYQVTQGEVDSLKVALPKGLRLLRVLGDGVRTWDIATSKGDQPDVLTVALAKAASGAYRLTLECEQPLGDLPSEATLIAPRAVDVQRESGLIALRNSEELGLTIVRSSGLQRIEAAEFYAAASGVKPTHDEYVVRTGDTLGEIALEAGVSTSELTKLNKLKNDTLQVGQKLLVPARFLSVFRYLKPDYSLALKAVLMEPQVSVTLHNHVVIGTEQIRISAQATYQVRKAGIFGVRLSAPAGYQIVSVTGEHVRQWLVTNPDTAPIIEVTLDRRTLGDFDLNVQLEETTMQLAASQAVAGLRPLGADKLTGFVTVASQPGVTLKTDSFSGLIEIPPTALTGTRPRLGKESELLSFKLVAGANAQSADWKLQVNTALEPARLQAEIVNAVTVSETYVSGQTLVRYSIENAPVKQFRVRVPERYGNVEVTGASIRRKDRQGLDWQVELQNAVLGSYQLTITWEVPRTPGEADLPLPGIEARDIERETGFVTLLTRPPLQIEPGTSDESLARIDSSELPTWAQGAAVGTHGEVPVLTYKYLRPGYGLSVKVKRFDEAAVLQALVDHAELLSVLSEDGQLITQVTLDIRNNGRQFVELTLPEGSTVWAAFVEGDAVRPNRKGSRVMLPLTSTATGEQSIRVELIYVGSAAFPKRRGHVELASPSLDIPVKDATWHLYLPPDFDYDDYEGSMRHDAESQTVTEYTVTTYNSQENSRKEYQRSKFLQVLSLARKGISSGQVSDANNNLKVARSLSWADDDSQKELSKLEKQVRDVQSGNLISSQSAYVESNARFNMEFANPQQKAAVYDSTTAISQTSKVQAAQELGETGIRPLRINLPTRGVRHSFSQLLQTDINKPMTVRFAVESQRHESGLGKWFLGACGFLALWILIAIAGSGKKPGKG